MSQSQLFTLQSERIDAIIRADVTDIQAIAPAEVQSIETHKHFIRLSIPAAPQFTVQGASNWSVSVTWRIRFYHSQLNADDFATQMSLYEYADRFINAFLSRRRMQLNGADLKFCTGSEFSFASGFETPLTFANKQYRGFDMNLRIHSANITRQAS